jgi:hypothetical protein
MRKSGLVTGLPGLPLMVSAWPRSSRFAICSIASGLSQLRGDAARPWVSCYHFGQDGDNRWARAALAGRPATPDGEIMATCE